MQNIADNCVCSCVLKSEMVQYSVSRQRNTIRKARKKEIDVNGILSFCSQEMGDN